MRGSPSNSKQLCEAVRAARVLWLPEVCFVHDLSATLGLSRAQVRRLLLRGALGPYGRVGRRYYVLRKDLLSTLSERATEASSSKSGPVLLPPREDRP